MLGKVCLVARFSARQKQVIQRLLFLPSLLQLIGVALLFAKFAEYLTVLMCGLIDGQLCESLGFQC